MNVYTILIISFLVLVFIVETAADVFNVKNISNEIPDEFKDVYPSGKYAKSQNYLKTRTKFAIVSSAFFLAVQIVFIVCGGFNYVDEMARALTEGQFFAGSSQIITGLIFAAILAAFVAIL
ncbi:MAG: hypothetical protein LBO62_08120, partial [Endomicrobium sp.]|nr:hypothetical protein [Endomicrobium sp.]